jgi:hypothetical protein
MAETDCLISLLISSQSKSICGRVRSEPAAQASDGCRLLRRLQANSAASQGPSAGHGTRPTLAAQGSARDGYFARQPRPGGCQPVVRPSTARRTSHGLQRRHTMHQATAAPTGQQHRVDGESTLAIIMAVLQCSLLNAERLRRSR